jgi:competence ComEA-like helix-hairpin-helix protein
MVAFKPAEIRILLVLSGLALLGSSLIILERQRHLNGLNLDFLADKGPYKYHYSAAEFPIRDSAINVSKIPNLTALQDSAIAQKVDINHCGYYDLEALPGIGPVMAQHIIAFRDSAGGFKSFNDILKVKGIGPAKLSAIKDKIEIK